MIIRFDLMISWIICDSKTKTQNIQINIGQTGVRVRWNWSVLVPSKKANNTTIRAIVRQIRVMRVVYSKSWCDCFDITEVSIIVCTILQSQVWNPHKMNSIHLFSLSSVFYILAGHNEEILTFHIHQGAKHICTF